MTVSSTPRRLTTRYPPDPLAPQYTLPPSGRSAVAVLLASASHPPATPPGIDLFPLRIAARQSDATFFSSSCRGCQTYVPPSHIKRHRNTRRAFLTNTHTSPRNSTRRRYYAPDAQDDTQSHAGGHVDKIPLATSHSHDTHRQLHHTALNHVASSGPEPGGIPQDLVQRQRAI